MRYTRIILLWECRARLRAPALELRGKKHTHQNDSLLRVPILASIPFSEKRARTDDPDPTKLKIPSSFKQ